jgi:hypothetical protein
MTINNNPSKRSKEAAAFTSDSDVSNDAKKMRQELDEARKQLSSLSSMITNLTNGTTNNPPPNLH